MAHNVVEVKDPSEEVILTFDFGPELLTTEKMVLAGSTVAVTCAGDPAPGDLLAGPAYLSDDERKLLQPVAGGLPGKRYTLKVVCPTTNPQKTLALTMVLPVQYI